MGNNMIPYMGHLNGPEHPEVCTAYCYYDDLMMMIVMLLLLMMLMVMVMPVVIDHYDDGDEC